MKEVGNSYAPPSGSIPVFLAPMSGVTDAPFRKQVEKFGASATTTEMVAGDELLIGTRGSSQRLIRYESSSPFIVQLVGREPAPMLAGARTVRTEGADVIDINMGCPSRKVTGGLSGSALMKDLEKAEQIIEAVLEGAGGIPVTLKMRLGWDHQSMNAAELAQRAERLGVRRITVHGRTRQCFYNGSADWSAISHVKEAVSVPVVANGDIVDMNSAMKALKDSNADALMVGRAATGQAWLPAKLEKEINGAPSTELCLPTIDVQVDSLKEQTADSLDIYGDRVGMRVVRKHIVSAFDHWGQTHHLNSDGLQRAKRAACCCETYQDLVEILDQQVIALEERELA